MRPYVSAILAVMLLLMAVPAVAHHSFASFWSVDKTVEITGIVRSVRLVNPHANMTVEVTDTNGEKLIWSVTSKGSVSALRQAGWKEDTVTIGMKIKIEGNPSRVEGAKGLAAGKITKPDGSVVWFGGGGNVPDR